MLKIRFRRPFFCSQLYISRKPYFIDRSRALGEKDLEDLVDTEKCEGCWLFDVERSRWFNLKINDTKTHGIMAMTPNFSGLGEVSHYHTHPKYFEEQDRKKLSEHFEEQDQFINIIVRNLVAINMAIPSKGDITTYSQIVQATHNHPVDFRIASPYGVMILEFGKTADTNEAIERYEKIYDNDKKLTEIAASVINPMQAISETVHLVNQYMQGVFTLSMEYKLGGIK